MGCGAYKSQSDCMLRNPDAQAGFTSHYADWIGQVNATEDQRRFSELTKSCNPTLRRYSRVPPASVVLLIPPKIASYGLNTIRIPLGYWIVESTVNSSEHFPKGGFAYLKQICGWAADAGLHVMLVLHAAPEAQPALQPFTCIPCYRSLRLRADLLTPAGNERPPLRSISTIGTTDESTSFLPVRRPRSNEVSKADGFLRRPHH